MHSSDSWWHFLFNLEWTWQCQPIYCQDCVMCRHKNFFLLVPTVTCTHAPKHAAHGHKKLLNRFFKQFFWTTTSCKLRERSWAKCWWKPKCVWSKNCLSESLAACSWSSFFQVSFLVIIGFFRAHGFSCAVSMRFLQVGSTN